MQKRGVLHLHLVVGYTTPSERAAVDRYVQELSVRSGRHGFGFVDRKAEVKEPSAAAAYLSSYFCGGRGRKLSLRESVTSEAMPPSIVYVAPALSQASGVTMRSLRLRRYCWRLYRSLEAQGCPLDFDQLWQGLSEGWTLAEIADEFL
jgi:hypothetical protein